ncbi:MAG: acylphosphatase [Anaerolineaceae bacterium]|nr:acylphosphatase [Anaerolineaceae bacterium]
MNHNENQAYARLNAFVKGYVQGVGFRFFVLQKGTDLHLSGWVRNRFNGDLEILAEGPREKLTALLREVRKGPPFAQVVDIDINWSQPKNDLPPFTVRATE